MYNKNKEICTKRYPEENSGCQILCKLYLNRKILISRSDVYFDLKLEKNFEGYTQLCLPLPSQ